MTPSAFYLRDQLLRAWTDHVVYTRAYLTAAIFGLAEREVIAERLMQNQDAIAALLGRYYGPQTQQEVARLLREHIQTAANLLYAVQSQNFVELDRAEKTWTANADEIARTLASLNPNWPEQTLRSMLQDHLRLTTEELKARMRGDWAAEVAWFDQALSQALHMADVMATGIYSQMPQQFAGAPGR